MECKHILWSLFALFLSICHLIHKMQLNIWEMQTWSLQNYISSTQEILCIHVKATTQNFMQILCICSSVILKRKIKKYLYFTNVWLFSFTK